MPRTTEPGNRLTAAGIAAFFDALAETGMVAEAARQAGVPRATLYRKKARDSRFAARWAAALEAGLDQLRDEAVRRAYHGVAETVWHRGEAVGTKRRYSDQLLMFLLRAHQPDIYREPRSGSDELRRAAAEKWAVRTVEEQEQAVADAFKRGQEDKSELAEILRQIDGETRGIHDTPRNPRPGEAVADAGGGSSDRDDAAGAGGEAAGDAGGDTPADRGGDAGGVAGSDGAGTGAAAGDGATTGAGAGPGVATAPGRETSGAASADDGAADDAPPPRRPAYIPVDVPDPRPRLARPIHEYDPYAIYEPGYGDT